MLRFHRLTFEDFGPFKGQQTIEFPEDGVVAVYGENMRGKTTLLNAIRYSLFGTVMTRHARALSLDNIENWERAQQGKHGFKVILNFSQDGSKYELTRECKLRRGITTPQSDSDYEQILFLQKDGVALGPSAADVQLKRIMPESVSRFFLFDGELLQQYEELLRDESEMGGKIKDAIERILGVPVLTNARTNLKRLLDEAQKSESKAAQKNQKTEELGNHHAACIEQRASHEAELDRLRNDLLSMKAKKVVLEDEVKKTERVRLLFSEKERLSKEIDEINLRQAEKEARLREVLSSAWKGLLERKIREAENAIHVRIGFLRQQESAKSSAQYLIRHIDDGLQSGFCPTCKTELNETSEKIIQVFREELREQSKLDDNSEEINRLNSQMAVLRSAESQSVAALVSELTESIEDCQMNKHLKNDRIEEIFEATKAIDESENRRILAEHDRTMREIIILEQGIGNQLGELTRIEQTIEKIEKQLDLYGEADLAIARRRRELAKRLYDLLNEAVDVYRDDLRVRVETDASKLFMKLTTEPEYAGLQINKNYGLTILHKDGSPIPVRSAGAEHIVALSLMGALQKNAPLQGPIIMDSPFGRLDNSHTTKVVEALPQMSNQVMLLVYESEMEPKIARQHLRGNLKREYEIMRQSARHSTIEVRYE